MYRGERAKNWFSTWLLQREFSNCGVPFQDVEVATIPVDVIVEYIAEHSPADDELMGLVETAGDDCWAQNTPADALYTFTQRSDDYTAGEAATISRKNTFPEGGRN